MTALCTKSTVERQEQVINYPLLFLFFFFVLYFFVRTTAPELIVTSTADVKQPTDLRLTHDSERVK